MNIKLDDYINKNKLSQDDVYMTVLLIEGDSLKGHVFGDKDLEIDQYAIHFLNDYYDIAEPQKIKKKEIKKDKELDKIEKSIIDKTFEELDIDNVSYDDIDLECRLDDNSSKKIEQETKKMLERITEKVNSEELIMTLENQIIQKEKDILILKRIIKEQNEVISQQSACISYQRKKIRDKDKKINALNIELEIAEESFGGKFKKAVFKDNPKEKKG